MIMQSRPAVSNTTRRAGLQRTTRPSQSRTVSENHPTHRQVIVYLPGLPGIVDLGVSPTSNGDVKPQPPDVISSGPRISRLAWATAVALLAAALAVAITAAVHFRGEVAALRRQVRPAPASPPPSTVPVTLSSSTVALPSYGTLNGQVTVFSARSSGELARIVLSVHVNGGRPHTRYTLFGFDCAGSPGYPALGRRRHRRARLRQPERPRLDGLPERQLLALSQPAITDSGPEPARQLHGRREVLRLSCGKGAVLTVSRSAQGAPGRKLSSAGSRGSTAPTLGERGSIQSHRTSITQRIRGDCLRCQMQ